MPERTRNLLEIKKIGPICPLLNEGEQLPLGLTDEQRLYLTDGRLAKDYSMGIRIVKAP
jgi:hypothetical protein